MNKFWLGLFLVIVGSIFWGSSGTITDLIISNYNVSPLWIVGVSFIISGILLLTIYKMLSHKSVFVVWHNSHFVKRLLAFGLLGMMPTQLLYFIAIKFSNASTATILQFTGPVFIIIYLSLKNRRWPNKIETISVLLAVSGTILLATKGNLKSLSISILGLLFGLGSGLASAFYTLLPEKLLKHYDAKLLCGWGFLLGGIPLLPFIFINKQPTFSLNLSLELIFVIIIGTMLAYLFYVSSIGYLNPTISGILASFEPLTATFLSIFLLNLKLSLAEIIGIIMILLMAIIQSISKK